MPVGLAYFLLLFFPSLSIVGDLATEMTWQSVQGGVELSSTEILFSWPLDRLLYLKITGLGHEVKLCLKQTK